MQVLNPAPTTPDQFHYYQHHPILTAWVSALFSSVAGLNEVSMRMVSILASMISITAFYVICRRLYGARVGWWGAAFYAASPMIAYFGRMSNHELLTLMFLMLFTCILINWLRKPSRVRWWALLIFGILAVWTAWAALFFIALFVLLTLWIGSRAQRQAMIVLGGLTVLSVIGLVAFYQAQWSGTIADLIEVFIWRSSPTTLRRGSQSFTMLE